VSGGEAAGSWISALGSLAGAASKGGGNQASPLPGVPAGGSSARGPSNAMAPIIAPPVTGSALANPVIGGSPNLGLSAPGGAPFKAQSPAPQDMFGKGDNSNAGAWLSAILSIAGLAASFASSARLKDDIEPLSGAQSVKALAETIYRLPVKTWRYKSDDPSRRRVGPILEEMPAFMREDALRIDPVTALGMLVATTQSQNARLKKLERRG
jgi:hypothetical protein